MRLKLSIAAALSVLLTGPSARAYRTAADLPEFADQPRPIAWRGHFLFRVAEDVPPGGSASAIRAAIVGP